LERKWPEKYNTAGQPAWHGRLYGNGRTHVLSWRRSRIYHGTWGCAPFQSVYEPAPSNFWSMARMPEWYLLMGALAILMLLGLLWWPLHAAWPLLILACGPPLVQAALCAARVRFSGARSSDLRLAGLRVLIAGLHLLQPLARLIGRLTSGLTPWRRRKTRGWAWPGWRTATIWSEKWRAPHEWLTSFEATLKAAGAVVIRGGNFDAWDLEVREGMLGRVRAQMVIEEHGGGRQLVRLQLAPRCTMAWFVLWLCCVVIAVSSALDYARLASAIFTGIAVTYWVVTIDEWARATAVFLRVARKAKRTCEAVVPPPDQAPRPVAVPEIPTAAPKPELALGLEQQEHV
jgi:hypothetical protein